MDYLGQQLVNGLTLGGVYALIALGYTLVYGVLQILNFAHGDVYMIGAFLGFFAMTWLGGPLAPTVPVALMLLVMFLIAMMGTGLLGIVIERFAYTLTKFHSNRPTDKRSWSIHFASEWRPLDFLTKY